MSEIYRHWGNAALSENNILLALAEWLDTAEIISASSTSTA
ncbi:MULTISPECIES: hypothetical protein [Halomonadaceae]|nr:MULTISPECIES: hypothetical protein [Halomonas]